MGYNVSVFNDIVFAYAYIQGAPPQKKKTRTINVDQI